MAIRRKCRLTDKSHRDKVDLTVYSQLIIDTINSTVPGKNPTVCKDHFSTDALTRREAVLRGMALSKLPQLNQYGKTITTFRLFDGKTCECGPGPVPMTQSKTKRKGGRVK